MISGTKESYKLLEALDKRMHGLCLGTFEIRICGGSALLLMGISSRGTRDVDVIAPLLPPEILLEAQKLESHFGLAQGWLNNGPSSLTRELETGWEDRCILLFEGSCLRVLGLGRRDLLATKLFALCDRDESDLMDFLALNPTREELSSLSGWVLERDASIHWPERVRKKFVDLKRRLGHET